MRRILSYFGRYGTIQIFQHPLPIDIGKKLVELISAIRKLHISA
jgi:hypothetical protein